MPRVSEYYGISGPVPFLDVEITTDNRMFLDPHAIRLRGEPEPFASQANACTTSFFAEIVECVKAASGSAARAKGRALLQRFGEPRETRLGMAREGFDGHGGAELIGSEIWDTLSTDLEAVVAVAVLGHLEDIPLFVRGVDKDITSDLTTRIIYGPLADFTSEMVNRYPHFRGPGHHIERVERQVWDPVARTWGSRALELPVASGTPLVLVPRGWARPRLLMSAGRYYETSVLSYAQQEQAVVLADRLVKTPKDRLKRQAELARGRATNLRVTLRAQTDNNDLVASFTQFVDERYKPGAEDAA